MLANEYGFGTHNCELRKMMVDAVIVAVGMTFGSKSC
jgi:hypothetical protein